MPFVRAWLVPRVVFWILWTIWLWCLQAFLLAWLTGWPELTLAGIVGPPLLITWIGSRFAKNPYDTPSSLFWKGAATSCLLAVFANFYLMRAVVSGVEFLTIALVVCGYMVVQGTGVQRMEVKTGDLFHRVHQIARQTGVSVNRVIVFTAPRNRPAAFAHRMGAILLSDRLLRVLSREETDAIVAHEAAHLRPVQYLAVAAVPILAASSVMVSFVWPEVTHSAPFWPVIALLLWRALRRMQEFSADASAVRVTQNPEALITALARISSECGLPQHWSRIAGLFLAHPPLTARARAIARRAGVNSARIDELLSNTGAGSRLPGYASPFAEPQPDAAGILAAHCDRLTHRMSLLSRGFPILAGIALTVAGRSWPPDFAASIALIALWIPASMLLLWIAYELTVGAERRRLRSQLADTNNSTGYFVGIATAAEPRYYDGLYHYDLGVARIDGGSLQFKGTRSTWSLGRSQVQRIWLSSGPRHWTPRKIVCIEYQLDDAQLAIISLQPLDRWFWPRTTQAARQLLAALSSWQADSTSAESPAALPPHAAGAIVPRVPTSAIWKSLGVSSAITFGVSWVIGSASMFELGTMLCALGAPVVTGVLIIFQLLPHLDWSRKPPQGQRSPRSAVPEPR